MQLSIVKIAVLVWFLFSCTTPDSGIVKKKESGADKLYVADKFRDIPTRITPKLNSAKPNGFPTSKSRMVPKFVKKSVRLKKYGSLFDPDGGEILDFKQRKRLTIGEIFPVKIITNRKSVSKKPGEANQNQDGSQNDTNNAELSSSAKEILDALPSLEPEKKEDAKVIDVLQFRFVQELENGYSILSANHSYSNPNGSRFVEIRAKTETSKLHGDKQLTTRDLFDVSIVDQIGSENFVRNSTYWDDEYSLRLSGFSEIGSKEARTIENKRRNLEKVRDRIETRIRNFSDRERKLAKERDELRVQKDKFKKEKENIEAIISEKDDKIKDQIERIKELEDSINQAQQEQAENAAAPETEGAAADAEE